MTAEGAVIRAIWRGCEIEAERQGVGARERVERWSLGGARGRHIGAAMKRRIHGAVSANERKVHTLLSSRHR